MECRDCRSIDSLIVHNIPHRGEISVLCTPCVLRYHPGCFCPICFDVYEDTTNNNRPSAHSRIMCHRCPALAHLTCLPSTRSSSTFRYLCSQCSDPSFSFFDISGSASNGSSTSAFTRDSAKQLLCAAQVAAFSMNRAAAVAKEDADQKVRGAITARRKAKEAVENVAHLVAGQQTMDESEVDDG